MARKDWSGIWPIGSGKRNSTSAERTILRCLAETEGHEGMRVPWGGAQRAKTNKSEKSRPGTYCGSRAAATGADTPN